MQFSADFPRKAAVVASPWLSRYHKGIMVPRIVPTRWLAAGWLLFACGAIVSAAQVEAPRGADSAGVSSEQIARWVDELGDDSFTVRQSAGEHLLAAGLAARGALAKVADGPDPEKRAAARRIVSLIDASDLRRRLDAFAADVDGRAGLTMPGWELYQKLVGRDARDRALFVEIQRQESTLLAAAFRERPSAAFLATWEGRLTRIVQEQQVGRNGSAPLASCAAMFFLASVPEMEVSDQVVNLLAALAYRTPLQEALQAGAHRESVRRLIAAWILHCPNNSDSSLQQRLRTATTQQFPEAVPMAISVATRDAEFRNVSTGARVLALLYIGQYGRRENVERLEPLLEDSTICVPAVVLARRTDPGPGVDVQMRDVALNVLLQLTDQRPADYGYPHSRRPTTQDMDVTLMYPRSAEERNTAIAKWRRWKAVQRRAPPEKGDGKNGGGT